MPQPETVELSHRQLERLAKDAAICAAFAQIWGGGDRIVKAAAARILKVLKLEE